MLSSMTTGTSSFMKHANILASPDPLGLGEKCEPQSLWQGWRTKNAGIPHPPASHLQGVQAAEAT